MGLQNESRISMWCVCPKLETSYMINIVLVNVSSPVGEDGQKHQNIHWSLKRSTSLFGITTIATVLFKLNLVQPIHCQIQQFVLEPKVVMHVMEMEVVH